MLKLLKTKRTKTIITILLCIFALFYLSTIAYSAFSSTMNITGLAHSRVESDVRITNFSLDEIVNATSLYEEFGKNHISTSIDFKENAYVIYKLEVTNYGTTDVGIYSIEGVPNEITYELIDYNLKEKICNQQGKCNNFASKTFFIKFTGINTSVEFNINFLFKTFKKISYTGFNNTYKSEVIDGDSIEINLSADSPKSVLVEPNNIAEYEYVNNILKLYNVNTDLEVIAISKNEYKYDYTGNYQTFTAPYDGLYRVELWGASGSAGVCQLTSSTVKQYGSAGGYTIGEIYLTKSTNLYVYVGESPQPIRNNIGFNNGEANVGGRNGGGSTDVRLVSGTWDNTTSINSRIMVAGAGGTSEENIDVSGPGGGLNGYAGNGTAGGTQTASGKRQQSNYTASSFGIANGGCTGGNGYYPGGGAGCIYGSGGGSSFISGHNGCVAITSSTSLTPKNDLNGNKCTDGTTDITCSYHYSNYIFKNTKMIDGKGYVWTTTKDSYIGIPTHDGTGTMAGNTGHGYAKITLLKPQIQYNVKYKNLIGNYPTKVNKDGELELDLSQETINILIVLQNNKEIDYEFKNNILKVKNISSDIEIINERNLEYTYSYTGEQEEFIVPYTGAYKIELWGAQGGYAYDEASYPGGLGAYTSGIIELDKESTLYVLVGKGNQTANNQSKYNYFGGGAGGEDTCCHGGDGGGATDIRLNDSINSRIMVAAGGGGSGYQSDFGTGLGSAGGGLISNDATGTSRGTPYIGTSATQTKPGSNLDSSRSQFCTGKFGYGGHACYGLTMWSGTIENYTGGGGGGGYYGGGGASDSTGGSGGTSFISGHNGCVAIASSSSTSPRNDINGNKCIDGTTDVTCSYHYSGYKFTETTMVDGAGFSWTTEKGTQTGMPTHDGISTMTGNTGDGYAKITLIRLT